MAIVAPASVALVAIVGYNSTRILFRNLPITIYILSIALNDVELMYSHDDPLFWDRLHIYYIEYLRVVVKLSRLSFKTAPARPAAGVHVGPLRPITPPQAGGYNSTRPGPGASHRNETKQRAAAADRTAR